jgi:hypothetical protein
MVKPKVEGAMQPSFFSVSLRVLLPYTAAASLPSPATSGLVGTPNF